MLNKFKNSLLGGVYRSPDEPAAPTSIISGAVDPGSKSPPTVVEQELADLDSIYDADVKPQDDQPEVPPENETEEQKAARLADEKKAADEKAAKDKADADAAEAKRKEADEKVRLEAEKIQKEAADRQKAFADAKTPEERKAAYDKLDAVQKKEAFDALSEDDRKALGITDPGEAPVNYEKPAMPEGMPFDDDAFGRLTGILANVKGRPTQAQVQQMTDLYIEGATKFVNQMLQAQYDKFVETRKTWVNEIKDDPTVGKAKYEESSAHVARALSIFCPDKADRAALNTALEITGAGDNLSIYKLLVAVGKAAADDRFVIGDANINDDDVDAADVLYDK